MPNQNSKNINYKDLDQGIKAAYSLGVIDGQADIRNQVEDMRVQLEKMLKTNKHLWRLMMKEHKADKAIKIAPAFTRTLLKTLKKAKSWSQFSYLKKKYEATIKEQTGR